MVNNNKILTVSYGTFSCTLEGFDDSFSTMKAIAEYFRDLASDDRYFGAEPPQLDAEMLARIAQRQISSPVAAYEGESGIVLRAGETDTVTEATAPVTQEPLTEVAKADEKPVAEDVIEDAVEEAEATEIEVAEIPVADKPIEDVIAEDVTSQAITDIVEPTVAAPDVAPMRVYVEPEVAKEENIVPAPDSIAAKLQRIRAVVSRNEASTKFVDSTEDENADGFLGAPTTLQYDEFEDDDRIAAEETAVELFVEDSADGDAQDYAAEAANEITNTPTTFDSIGSAEATNETDSKDTSADLTETEDDDLFGDENQTDDDDDLANLLEDVRKTNKTARPLGNARVLKIKRTDFEAAVVSGQIEPISETDNSSETTLSDEDEAELMRELAEVESEDVSDAERDTDNQAEIDHAGDEDPLESDFAYDDEDTQVAPSLPPAADEDENDLSRLMDAADTKMEEPETTSRREAYSHFRAAVTVANAEQAAGGSVNSDTDDGAYREDLASVVRPRRPAAIADAAPSKRPSRPVAGNSAPLKLVAEQRVDDHAEQAPRGPVRPRRVSAVRVDETHLAGDETTGGFAEFAQEMEARGLKELLEAAASYMSFVEGREHFSRPQLMTKVRQVETSNFNREDGLRSFGKLLREGKIQKTSGGRFTASEDIGFRPDERAAG